MIEISCTIESPHQLLNLLPHHLSNIQEASALFSQIIKDTADQNLNFFCFSPSSLKSYPSTSAAFADLYPGSVEAWESTKCEDYQCSFRSYTHLQEDWFIDNGYQLFRLPGKIIILLP